MPGNKYSILLCVIIIFSFALRIYRVDEFGVWDDEQLSLLEANGSLNYDIVENTPFTKNNLVDHNKLENVVLSCVDGDGGNGILYITTLHYWTNLFSNSDFAIRMLSLIMGVLLVLVSYFLSKELFNNKKVSLFIAFLFSMSPLLISYSQSARGYMLATLLTVTSTFYLFRILNNKINKSGGYIIYSLLIVLSMLTHYLTVYIFIAHLVIVLMYRKDQVKLKKFIVCYFFSGCIFSIWLFNGGFDGMKKISERNIDYAMKSEEDPDNTFYMSTSAGNISKGWVQNILSLSGNGMQNSGLRLRHLIIALIVPFSFLLFAYKEMRGELRIKFNSLMILVLVSLIYATTLALIAGHIISFQTSYSIFSAPYMLMLIGYSFIHFNSTGFRASKIKLLFIVQILIMCGSLVYIYNGDASHTKGKNDLILIASEAEKFINANKTKDIHIIYNSIEIAKRTNLYLTQAVSEIPQIFNSSSEQKIIIEYLENGKKKVALF